MWTYDGAYYMGIPESYKVLEKISLPKFHDIPTVWTSSADILANVILISLVWEKQPPTVFTSKKAQSKAYLNWDLVEKFQEQDLQDLKILSYQEQQRFSLNWQVQFTIDQKEIISCLQELKRCTEIPETDKRKKQEVTIQIWLGDRSPQFQGELVAYIQTQDKTVWGKKPVQVEEEVMRAIMKLPHNVKLEPIPRIIEKTMPYASFDNLCLSLLNNSPSCSPLIRVKG